MTEFTKNELETGMVVETKNGNRYMVLKGDIATSLYSQQELLFVGKNDFLAGYKFQDTLRRKKEVTNFCDIVKIYAPDVKDFVSTLQACNESNLLWERKEVDWSKMPVDTKILVKDDRHTTWNKRYFAKYENGKVYAFCHGATSWATSEISDWDYAKLAEGDEEA